MMNATLRAAGVAALALLSLAACTVNEPAPMAVAPAPSPVVVTPAAPSAGTVIVQPKPY